MMWTLLCELSLFIHSFWQNIHQESALVKLLMCVCGLYGHGAQRSYTTLHRTVMIILQTGTIVNGLGLGLSSRQAPL